jgi:hypothetical protein
MKQKGVHVIPIEDLVPNCFHAVVAKIQEIRDKLGTEITQKSKLLEPTQVEELQATADDLLSEIKDANFNMNYLHIGCVEGFANLLAKAGLGPYKRQLDEAVAPAYEYVRTRQRQPG